jgi:hypothetical protein
MKGWGAHRWPPYHTVPWPRFYAASLTGFTDRGWKQSTCWYVFDRGQNCTRIRGPYWDQWHHSGRDDARRIALEMNLKWSQ